MLRNLGVDLAPRLATPDGQPSASPIPESLRGLVVLSVGPRGPEQTAVNRALKAAGAVVLAKASLAETVQVLRSFIPSLVVIPITPGGDGGSAWLRAIRMVQPDDDDRPVPVIGICARSADVPSATRGELQAVLAEPFEPDAVVRTVLGVIDSAS
jgi:ActR/RegA family two-component response regulator